VQTVVVIARRTYPVRSAWWLIWFKSTIRVCRSRRVREIDEVQAGRLSKAEYLDLEASTTDAAQSRLPDYMVPSDFVILTPCR